jgi:hypothetical protein
MPGWGQLMTAHDSYQGVSWSRSMMGTVECRQHCAAPQHTLYPHVPSKLALVLAKFLTPPKIALL